MKIKILLTLFLAASINFTYADDHRPTTFAMEALQCNFQEGKDMDDAMKVISEWKVLADKNFTVPYNAWTLTPLYTSQTDFPFKFAWMGFTQNMADMGTMQDTFQEVGQKTFAKWQKATDCAGQSLFRVIEARAPKYAFTEGQIGYMSISSCSFKEGKSGSDLAESDKAWNAYNDKNGHEGGVYRWWPGPGNPTDADFDFYLAIGYNSVEAFGKARDQRMVDMWDDARPESILNCNTPRVYQTQNVRLVQSPE